MRILHVHCRYREPGGEDAVVDAERRLLSDSGYEVVAHDTVNPAERRSSIGPLLVSAWNPAAYVKISRLVRQSRPDVAHVHNTWFSLSPSILEALHRLGLPVAMTLHNYRLACGNGLLFRDGKPCTDCVGHGLWRGVVHRCYRSSALASSAVAGTATVNRALGTWRRNVDQYLVLNGLAHDVLVRSGLPAEKVVRTANFVADPGPRTAAPSMSRTLVYVGRMSYEKGADVLLDAWRSWRPDEPWTLVMIGDGPLRPALERRADARVRFVGRIPRDEVARALQSARALLLPSLVFEGQPMAALEAFAAGLGVLGSGTGGTLEVIRPLGPEWSVDTARPEAWTRALDVVRRDDAVDMAGRAARRAYQTTYSTTAAIRRARGLYARLAPGSASVGVAQ